MSRQENVTLFIVCSDDHKDWAKLLNIVIAWRGIIVRWIIENTDSFLVVKYEDIVADTVTEIKRIIDFLNFTVTNITQLSQALKPDFEWVLLFVRFLIELNYLGFSSEKIIPPSFITL